MYKYSELALAKFTFSFSLSLFLSIFLSFYLSTARLRRKAPPEARSRRASDADARKAGEESRSGPFVVVLRCEKGT